MPAWVAAGAGLAGAVINSNASRRAGNQQAQAAQDAASLQNQATNRGLDMQQAQYDQARADNQVYRTGGGNAFNALTALSGATPASTATRVNDVAQAPDANTLMSQDPGVQYRMDMAAKALERKASANGGGYGAGMSADMANLMSGLASQEYGNAYNRWQQDNSRQFNQGVSLDQRDYDRSQTMQNTQWNRLQTLANMGLGATNETTQAGQSFANNSGNLLQSGTAAANNYTTQAAANQAAGTVGASNAWSNAIGQVGNAAQGYYYQNRGNQTPIRHNQTPIRH